MMCGGHLGGADSGRAAQLRRFPSGNVLNEASAHRVQSRDAPSRRVARGCLPGKVRNEVGRRTPDRASRASAETDSRMEGCETA